MPPCGQVVHSGICAVCGTPLRARQDAYCSRSCASRGKYAASLGRLRQDGEHNGNFKGWASRQPYRYVKAFKQANPEKARAHRLVHRALAAGVLTRPSVCAACLRACRPDAHHADYTLPLSVDWLCRKCHITADRLRQRALETRATLPEQANRHLHIAEESGQQQLVHGRQSQPFARLRLRTGR